MIRATHSSRSLRHALRKAHAENSYSYNATSATRTTAAQQFYRAFFHWTKSEAQRSKVRGQAQALCRRHGQSSSSSSLNRIPSPRRTYSSTVTATAPLSSSSSSSSACNGDPQIQAHQPSCNPATNSDPNPLSTRTRHLFRKIPHPVVLITTTQPDSPSSSTHISASTSLPESPEHHLEHRFRGMTVSSFTSLTLDPFPIIAFNVLLPSRTYSALAASREFLVHILAANKDGADVAARFTKGDAVGAFRSLALPQSQTQSTTTDADPAGQKTSVGVLGSLRNACASPRGADGGSTTDGLPLVTGPGVMHVLRCELFDPLSGMGALSSSSSPPNPTTLNTEAEEIGVRVGSHVIVMGKVVGVIDRDLDLDQNQDQSRHDQPSSSPSSSSSSSSPRASENNAQAETNTALVYVDRRFGRVGGDLH